MKAGEGRLLVRTSATRFMCAQRDEFDKTSFDQFAHEITVDVDVARKFSAHWILTHSNICQIILIDFNCVSLLITQIFEDFKKEGLLPGLAGGNEFGFGGRQTDIDLTAALPRDKSAIHHKDIGSV